MTLVRQRTSRKARSMGLVVRTALRCPLGQAKNARRVLRSCSKQAAALGASLRQR